MKKAVLVLVSIIAVCLIVCLIGSTGASGKNVTGISTNENMVWFEPKCPECGHIGRTYSINLCDGEKYNTRRQCEHCFNFYDISIER